MKRTDGVSDRGGQMCVGRGVRSEPSLDLAAKLGIVVAVFGQEPAPSRLLTIEGLMEESLDAPPAVGIHDAWSIAERL